MTIQTTDDNMTQGEILVMARQVGYTPFEALKWEQALTDFAKLVAADADAKATAREREACAKVCDVIHMLEVLANPAEKCAKAIRARRDEVTYGEPPSRGGEAT